MHTDELSVFICVHLWFIFKDNVSSTRVKADLTPNPSPTRRGASNPDSNVAPPSPFRRKRLGG